MNSSQDLYRKALRGALDIRSRARVSRSAPICVYDLAETVGVEVKFIGGNSFGGMYSKTTETVLVPALRPPGRQAFTCGHEIGHWYFGHGNRVEEVDALESDDSDDPEERLANAFAGYLLAPPWAVKEAYERRKWDIGSCTTTQAYVVAVQLGLGYQTLVHHLRWSLKAISGDHASRLLRMTPKDIRRSCLGFDHPHHLIIADQFWTAVPIDLQVGDIALLPFDAHVEGQHVSRLGAKDGTTLVQGVRPGISQATRKGSDWAAFIRVARRGFTGRSIYRHMEDNDVDADT